ncbi:hypothetical protein [Paenibacillus sp. B-A-8]|uniref:hypothetical protein n=1 Tax=Paenibacillus sp. B-A-8 TaxID=3400419 RepID=UPI003B01E0E2
MIKKKILILSFFVACLVMVPSLIYSAQSTDVRQGTVIVPLSTGLIGSGNSTKTFYLDIPIGVTSSAIKSGTLKYSGNNSVVGVITLENGKIKLTLKGNVKDETFPVMGKDGAFEDSFISVPGNSIWRYADGRRWQINDYKDNQGINVSYNVNATDYSTPSETPPTRTVMTKSDPANPSVATWYRQDQTQVPYSSVVQSSIKLNPQALVGDKGTVSVKNGMFIITYTVPSAKKRPEEVSESFGKGGHAKGWLYYVTLPYYFDATAKVTSYSYAGTVNFDYTLPTEPTLTGTVTLNKPNPNPTKLGDKDEPVQISLMGQLQGYNDASNIDEWVFYAKEKDRNNTLKTKKESAKTFNVSTLFDFEIKKSSVTGEHFTQEYALTVLVRFKKPIVTKNGTITSLEQPLQISAGVYKNNPTVTFPPPPTNPTTPEGKPPIARISAPRYVKAGDDTLISGAASYDPDGYINIYVWENSGAQGEIGNASKGYVWYTPEQVGQTFPIALTVVDNENQTGSTSREITVTEPKPSAGLAIEGTLKQNRKTTLFNRSQSPTRFPLVSSKTRVTITAVSGGTNADIKYSGTLSDFENKDVLFKKPGKYKATIYVENTLGYSDSSEITFDIVPDEVPYNYFTLPGVVYRSPDFGNKAVVSLDDISYSSDKDVIGRRLWEYRYDSNNDGSFEGEKWVIFSNENADRLNLELSEVGKYEVRLTVFEEFGQPTIDEFVTEADRKSTNSDGQKLSSRVVEVKNRAPEVDWSW